MEEDAEEGGGWASRCIRSRVEGVWFGVECAGSVVSKEGEDFRTTSVRTRISGPHLSEG